MKRALLFPLLLLIAAFGLAQSLKLPSEDARRVSVLFIGAPTAAHPGHDPIERYRVIKKALGDDGIDFSYTEDLADINTPNLAQYDAVLLYANWNQNEPMDPSQEKALIGFVENGGGFLPIHCASACFGGSDAFVKLVGGRFKSHGDGIFTTTITAPNHPVMRGFQGFETWDETYVHDRHGDDRTILQKREDEPWTWVRNQGKGKVFYTAYGHDMRCWGQDAFHELLRRGILWSVGEQVRAKLTALKLPELETEEMILPGYLQRKAITQGQKPLPAAESMKMAQVPTGFELSLFASEPDIVNPIYIAWDHRGRAFVVETIDYPNNLQAGNIGNDRIKICEDTNNDGKADKFTIFADKLSIPTTIVFANGGIISTNGSDVLFLQDTDGDDKADVRKVLFTGFGMGDTHAGPSNFRYGHDNWIYGTVGYSGFRGKVGGKDHQFSSGYFRFRPDGSEMEYLQPTTNNTWGLGTTSDFDILGSTANGNPSWYPTLPKGYYDAAGLPQPRTPNADNNPKFFPSSTDIRQVDQFDRYTAAAGHAFYTSTRFPEAWRDRIAFVTGPTGKLVGQFAVTPKGAGYTAQQLPNNLYNSADGWSAPVHAETGPDGAVWICDWYNIIIQHNPTPTKASSGVDAQNGRGNAYETPLRDVKHGRIYRVYPKGTTDEKNPNLDPADPGTLFAGLSNENLLWRLHAQRLIVETRSTTLVEKLKETIKTNTASPRATLHAFYALQGLGALDLPTITTALTSDNRPLRRAAIANAPADDTLANTIIKDSKITIQDQRELLEALAALTRTAPSDTVGAALHATLVARKDEIIGDPALNDAWQIAARHHSAGVLAAAAKDPAAAAKSEPVNLIPDPTMDAPIPGAWTLRTYGARDPQTIQLTAGPGRNGGKSLTIVSPNPADVGAGLELKVKPNTRYRLGGWVKTQNVRNTGGRGVLFNIHGGETSRAISGNNDWTELSLEFSTGGSDQILIHCLFGGYGGSTGTAWFDDLYLQEIASGDISGSIQAVANHAKSRGTTPAKPIDRKHKPDPAVHERGLAVYTLTCIACHGPEGKGVPGAFPPLDGADWLTGDPTIPIRIVLHGLQGPIEVSGQKFESIMPPHIDLNDQQIADVLTYARQTWSNDAPPVTAETVKATRAKNADRKLPWTATELKP